MKSAIKSILPARVAALGVSSALLLTLALGLSGTTNADAQDAKPAATITAPTFAVGGAVGKPGAWSAARLEQEFAGQIKTVDYVLKGVRHKAKCVPLVAVLSASAPRINSRIKHHELALTLLVQGKDGYTVAFSWAELQDDIGKRDAWLALDRDGKPLPADAAPIELIVPGDEKPGRWVHGIFKIIVTDGAAFPDDTKSAPSP